MDILGLFSRRNMLLGLGGAAATGAFVMASGPAWAGGKTDVPLNTAAYDDWSAQVNSNFTAHTGQVLKLVEVQAYPVSGTRPSEVRTQGFVARFDITRGAAMAEGRYLVAHPRGGTFEIFLTKGGPDKPLRMLADFN